MWHVRGQALKCGTILSLLIALAVPASAAAAQTGDYTSTQASRGATVYAGECALCHGAALQGKVGPALAGSNFATSLDTAKMSAAALFKIISTQMPLNKPGSLTPQQSADVFAYILAQNGYPEGSRDLTAQSMAELQLLPYPKSSVTHATVPEEASRVASTQMTTGPGVPASVAVSVNDQMLKDSAADSSDWLAHGHDYGNQRYSTLTQINSRNVGGLVPAAIVQTGFSDTSFEMTPVVVHGVMYVTTGVVNQQMEIMALNAATGELYWQTTLPIGFNQTCCGPVNRGVAVAYGNVYLVTIDNQLVSLNAKNGALQWQKTFADAKEGYSETMAPQVYNHELIIGSSGGEWPTRGFVAAYSADAGKQLWRWEATGQASFPGDTWKHGGGEVWTTPAVDTKLGLVFFSTGNPNPVLYGKTREGDNLYTDSIIALDAKTGKIAWHYQEVKHDVWDYDAASNVMLFDVKQDGRTVPAAGEAGKVGWFFIVNRATGQLIRKSAPFVLMNKNMFTPPDKKGVEIMPGAFGGSEWSPPAFSPETRNVYILGMNLLMNFTTEGESAVAYVRGQVREGSVHTNVEMSKGGVQNGVLSAVNVDTGAIAWKHPTPQPLVGGALATAGNLVFFGEGNGNFDAVDAASGQQLWHFNMGAGVNAPPITYEVDGAQYVAVAAGGNSLFGYPTGDAIAIFKLPASH
ncbi:alcohol dehydrogenase (cytochrome c) [Rhodanobacter sp. TND4EL1]